MNLLTAVLYLHIASAMMSVGLFVLYYWWTYHQNPLPNQRQIRIAPHHSDTLLSPSGAGLMATVHHLPFTEGGTWLTEKLSGVIIYIALGLIVPGRRRPRSQQSRSIVFLLALVVLFIIIQFAVIRMLIPGQSMGSLTDFEFNKTLLCDGMAPISGQARNDFPSRFIEEELQRLLRLAQEETTPLWDQERQMERLLALFYDEWGSDVSQSIYRLSSALWLGKALVNRQGSAVPLGAVLLWIAQRLALPVVPMIFPTQMLLHADPETNEEIWLVDPFNGETPDEHTLEVWLRGNIGPVAELSNEDLNEADNVEVIHELLDTLKSVLMEERQMGLALCASETLLQFNPEDPYEIRDHGLTYAQLDCDHVALLDLSYSVEQCPKDPISEMIRTQINMISYKQVTSRQSRTVSVTS